MLTQKLLTFTLLGAEWILWTLLALSVVSVTIMLDRARFLLSMGLKDFEGVEKLLLAGKLDEASKACEGSKGMEAEVVREGVKLARLGPDAVEEVIAGVIARRRLDYERRLAFLGTLGNNAPFIGLFGTVLGIIRSFSDLASMPKGGAPTVMAGISEALVATAVGLFVALPAVVAYNSFSRQVKKAVSRSSVLGHALAAHLKSRAPPPVPLRAVGKE